MRCVQTRVGHSVAIAAARLRCQQQQRRTRPLLPTPLLSDDDALRRYATFAPGPERQPTRKHNLHRNG